MLVALSGSTALTASSTEGLALSAVEGLALSAVEGFDDAEPVTLPAAAVKAGKTTLVLDLSFAPGWHLNPLAPFRYSLDGGKTVKVRKPHLPLSLAYDTTGKSTAELAVALAYCRSDGKGVCKTKTLRLIQPLLLDPAGPARLVLRYRAQ